LRLAHLVSRLIVPLLALAAMAQAAPADAQANYPGKPILLVVPFAAGGPTDILGRVLAADLGPRLGQTIVVENKAGATGSIGQDFVSKAAPDGHTLVMITNTSSNNYHLMHRTIDFYKDFSMIGQIYSTYIVVAVNPAAQGMADVRTLTQLVAYAKANPGAVNYTSSGTGSLGHLAIEKVKSTFGIQMEHINYKGQGPATNDVLAGRLPMISATYTLLPLIKSGKLRAIAIGTPKRAAVLPDTPTFLEQGVTGLIAGTWVGLAAPPGTTKPIIDRLTRELQAGLAKPETAEKVKGAVGIEPEYAPPAEFAAFATRDWDYWGKVIREAGIKGE